MNDSIDQTELLSDVLADAQSATGRRNVLLGETLRLVRRRRRLRQVRRAASLVVVAAGLALLVWPGQKRRPPVIPSAASYVLVQTEPLPESSVVRTRTLAATSVVSSRPTVGAMTTTGPSRWLHEIRDDELLALAVPSSVVLVRRGPDAADLVFTDPAPSAQ